MNRSYSLKKNYEIEKIVRNRRSVGNKYFVIYYRKAENLKIAFSVSKKYGCAVERNYAKRVIRELIRDKLEQLPRVEMIIVVKPLTKPLTYLEKKEQLDYLIKKLKKETQNES